MFTHFDLSVVLVFDQDIQEYLVYGRGTTPDTGRPHLKGFVIFKNHRNLCIIKCWMPGAYFGQPKRIWQRLRATAKNIVILRSLESFRHIRKKINAFRDVLDNAEITTIRPTILGSLSAIRPIYCVLNYLSASEEILWRVNLRSSHNRQGLCCEVFQSTVYKEPK